MDTRLFLFFVTSDGQADENDRAHFVTLIKARRHLIEYEAGHLYFLLDLQAPRRWRQPGETKWGRWHGA